MRIGIFIYQERRPEDQAVHGLDAPMKPERIETERLQAMLFHAHEVCRAEDCINRIENRALALQLKQNRHVSILECWGGEIWEY